MRDTETRNENQTKDSPKRSEGFRAESYILGLEEYALHGMRPRPPAKRYYRPKRPTLGISMLQVVQERSKTKYIPVVSPSESKPGTSDQPYRAFYAEWHAYLGPYPEEPLPPPVPFQEDVEAGMFPLLFPYGIGHYLGPTGHPTPLTFEEYAQCRLTLDEDSFRKHVRWLLWALSRTESKDLAAAINLALVLFHGQKSRHLGHGEVEGIPISDDFKFRVLKDGKLVPPGTRR